MKPEDRNETRSLERESSLATASGIAIAQPRPGANAGNAPTYDPAQLPALSGKVAQFLPGGDMAQRHGRT